MEPELHVTMTVFDIHGTLGVIQTLPGDVHAKATHIADGKVYGQAMWPDYPEPIRFWTRETVWSHLCQGRVLKALPPRGA